MPGIGELRQRHQERAAPAVLRLDLLAQRVEHGQDLVARIRTADRGGRIEPLAVKPAGPLDVGRYQVVLRGEQPVQGGRGHVCLGRDPVDAGGPYPLPVEQLVRDAEHVPPRFRRTT